MHDFPVVTDDQFDYPFSSAAVKPNKASLPWNPSTNNWPKNWDAAEDASMPGRTHHHLMLNDLLICPPDQMKYFCMFTHFYSLRRHHPNLVVVITEPLLCSLPRSLICTLHDAFPQQSIVERTEI